MSFSQSSQYLNLDGSILTAHCAGTDGEFEESSINLDDILGNNNGNFAWEGSGFSGSARNFRLEDAVLVAELENEDGEWVEARIDLDERVTNNNGRLELQ